MYLRWRDYKWHIIFINFILWLYHDNLSYVSSQLSGIIVDILWLWVTCSVLQVVCFKHFVIFVGGSAALFISRVSITASLCGRSLKGREREWNKGSPPLSHFSPSPSPPPLLVSATQTNGQGPLRFMVGARGEGEGEKGEEENKDRKKVSFSSYTFLPLPPPPSSLLALATEAKLGRGGRDRGREKERGE